MLLGCKTAPCIAPPVARLPESAYCDICFGLESWMSLVERAKISDVFPEGLCWWHVSRNMLRNSAERGNSPPCSPRVPGEQLWRGCLGVLEELLDHLLRAAQASTSLAASVCPSSTFPAATGEQSSSPRDLTELRRPRWGQRSGCEANCCNLPTPARAVRLPSKAASSFHVPEGLVALHSLSPPSSSASPLPHSLPGSRHGCLVWQRAAWRCWSSCAAPLPGCCAAVRQL